MTMNIIGYTAPSVKTALEPYRFERRIIRSNDVVIEILYCGVCHRNIHYVQNDWRRSIFPFLLGHEIIGRVTNIGPDVTRFKQGDYVGVGCMVDSCQHCAVCKHGLEQYCEEGPTFTYDSKDRIDQIPTFSCYSKKIIVAEKFVLQVPDGMAFSYEENRSCLDNEII